MAEKDLKSYRWYFGIILLLLCSVPMLVSGCSNNTYTKVVGDTSFSFEYYKNHHLYPYSRVFIRSDAPIPQKLTGGIEPEALISVSAKKKEANDTHIEIYIAFMHSQKGITHFGTNEKGTINLDGITAEYIRFGYDAYDTWWVSYSGIFISFIFQGYVVDIDILSPTGNMGADEAFDLLIDTFKIND